MDSTKKVTAIIGSYRQGGVTDTVVDEILAAAEAYGATVTRIHLMDKHVEFCTNCRSCTQQNGNQRGVCHLNDDLDAILQEIEQSDGLVLASPVNFGTVTAVMKRFLERLVCFAYWPWGAASPTIRKSTKDKRAILVITSAAPALMTRFLTGISGLMKRAAELLGASKTDMVIVGLAALKEKPELSERLRKKAGKLGRRLVR